LSVGSRLEKSEIRAAIVVEVGGDQRTAVKRPSRLGKGGGTRMKGSVSISQQDQNLLLAKHREIGFVVAIEIADGYCIRRAACS
jgi:hypothetical protein